jgi:hypothetical protein
MTSERRRRDKADDGSELYVHVVYRQLSSYLMTNPQPYDKGYITMEPFLTQEDCASYNLSLWELSLHYVPVKSMGVRLGPPLNELAAVAEEVEVESGGSGRPRRIEMRGREQIDTLYDRSPCDFDWARHHFTHISESQEISLCHLRWPSRPNANKT